MRINLSSEMIDDQGKALYNAGIPVILFFSGDIQSEYERLKAKGVVFRTELQFTGPVMAAIFEDPCSNLIQWIESE